MSNVVSSSELTLYRTPGKKSLVYGAILKPPIMYRARVNQVFTSTDQIVTITYDDGTGTLANVLPDMEVWVGTTTDSYNKGICRLRDRDATHFYLAEVSDIAFQDNDYVTIVANYGVWARPIRTPTPTEFYVDEVAYTDQHDKWDPVPIMGSHQIVELTGAAVNTNWSGANSYCLNSSITGFSWSSPTASASAGTDTAYATLQFDTVGWHLVFLTLTAANGKTFFGVRYVYVYDAAHPPARIAIERLEVNAESGGWTGEFTMYTGASLTDFYERAMVVIFTKDYYGATQQAIGPVPQSENVRFVGWIHGEVTTMKGEDPSIRFTASGAAYWMTRVPSWPDGIEIRKNTYDWTNIPNLTVDLGLMHLLRWRSTLTRVADVSLTGDTRLAQETTGSSQNLWSQLQETTWMMIYARPGVNAQGQFSCQIHPNLIPVGSRTAPTVMAITKSDVRDDISFERSTVPDVSMVDMSGVVVTAFEQGSAYFALAPGHSLPRHGEWDIQGNLLLSGQAQVITLAGLWRSYRNNPFKDITLEFAAPVAKLDCFPNMKCTMTISAADNLRGWAFSGGLIPTRVALIHDAESGYLYTEAAFESETFESSSTKGDTPGSPDNSQPPNPTFPSIPIPGSPYPGIPPGSDGGPKRVLFLDTSAGLIYVENFNSTSPTYYQVNNGLSFIPYTSGSLANVPVYKLITRFFVCPNGSVYVFCPFAIGYGSWYAGLYWFGVWRAPYIGGTFVPIYDWTSVDAALGRPAFDDGRGLFIVAPNMTVPEQVMFMAEIDQTHVNIHLGANLDYPITFTGSYGLLGGGAGSGANIGLTFGLNKWIATKLNGWYEVSPAGVYVAGHALGNVGLEGFDLSSPSSHRAGTTGKTFFTSDFPTDKYLFIGTNNMASYVVVEPPAGQDFTGFACDPSGNFICGRYMSGKSKSTDGGSSWAALASLPPGNWRFAYAGPGPILPRFICASGTYIQYSEDMFTTYVNKMSSSWYPSISAAPNPVGIQVLEY